jgi:hypothetical protein
MKTSPFKLSTAASWVSLIICAIVFVYIALAAANTVSISGAADRDAKVREVRASTDTQYLQERAAMLIQAGAFTSQLSMTLCRLSLGALLVAIICSGVTVVQARRVRREINEAKRTG